MPNNNRLQPIWAGLTRNNRWNTFIHQEDVDTFNRRMESEGPEFYARGFAALRSSFLSGFQTGTWEIKGRFGLKQGTSLPRFLYGATSLVYNDDATLRAVHDIDVDAVACVNQLLAVFTKLKGGHTPQSEVDVIDSFVKTEDEIKSTQIDRTQTIKNIYLAGAPQKGSWDLEYVLIEASRLIRRVLAGSDPREIKPKHGSGVSACGTPLRFRYATPRYVDKIDRIWPMSEYYFASPTAFCDKLDQYLRSEVVDPCAKVLLVPKDARGPRLISCEPKETMWIQQGLMAKLYSTIEGHPLTRGLVNFTNQTYNQVAAYAGSKPPVPMTCACSEEDSDIFLFEQVASPSTRSNKPDVGDDRALHKFEPPLQGKFNSAAGKLATLDLKDASDRLRLDIVQSLFPENWAEALTACRSGSTELPDGRLITLNKHAPMGSAVCFPVMALVIWSLLTAIAPKTERKLILVYGDDIIVPSHLAEAAMSVLEAVGLAVNTSKSFVRGPFRESCGKEYFNGKDITPVRLRQYLSDDVESLMSCISFSNNYTLQSGYSHHWLACFITKEWGASNVPTVPYRYVVGRSTSYWDKSQMRLVIQPSLDQSSALSGVLWSDSLDTKQLLRRRWNNSLQKEEFHILVPQPRKVKYLTSDWCHVLRALVNPSDNSELGTDTVHNRVRFVRRWLSLR
jgi:hypothetical protein